VFSRDGKDILTIDADSVESVGEAGLPHPTRKAARHDAI
jgi:hypothetical protein